MHHERNTLTATDKMNEKVRENYKKDNEQLEANTFF